MFVAHPELASAAAGLGAGDHPDLSATVMAAAAAALGLVSRPQCKVLLVGLDNAGKTTIMNQVMPEEKRYREIVPTTGLRLEQFSISTDGLNADFTVMDMSGASTHRDFWPAYYTTCDAVVFVVDSTDKARIGAAKRELDEMLAHSDMKERRVPILVLANKIEIVGGLSPMQIQSSLTLDGIKSKPWNCM